MADSANLSLWADERTEYMMGESARFNPVQYVDVSTSVLAGIVLEWDAVALEANDEATGGDGQVKADVLMNLIETTEQWSRRRGLGGATPRAAVEDATRFLSAHPLSDLGRARVKQKIRSTLAQRERTLALLEKLGRL